MATQYYLMRGVFKPYAITDDRKFIGGLHLEKWLDTAITNSTTAATKAAPVFTGGISTDSITETTAGAGITLSKAIIRKLTATAINSTGSATAAQLAGGLITSTSAAATSITLPTATLLATQLGAVRGTVFDFIVDNSVGANIVTVVVNTGITVGGAVITGEGTLTVAAGAVGIFKLYFTATTTALLFRAN